jgi:phosphoribosyl-ATP pyrophosphohydrolase
MNETILKQLADVIESRRPERGGDPNASYVARLLAQGPDAVLKKVGEEATEVVMAAKDAQFGGARERIVAECADLWFHCLVLLAQHGLRPDDVLAELARRAGTSGIEEKAARKAISRERSERLKTARHGFSAQARMRNSEVKRAPAHRRSQGAQRNAKERDKA